MARSPEAAAGDTSLADHVASRLRRDILDGTYRPGSRVSQEALAKKYGTSRIPVREALRHLASEGLIVLEQDVGARIAILSVSDLIDVYHMREAIEPMLLEQSIPHLADDHLATMQSALREGEEHAKALDADGYLECDRRFHLTSYEGAEMPRIRRAASEYWDMVEWFRRLYTFLPRGVEFALLEHRLLMDAVQERRSTDAGALLKVHIRRTRTALMENRDRLADIADVLPGAKL